MLITPIVTGSVLLLPFLSGSRLSSASRTLVAVTPGPAGVHACATLRVQLGIHLSEVWSLSCTALVCVMALDRCTSDTRRSRIACDAVVVGSRYWLTQDGSRPLPAKPRIQGCRRQDRAGTQGRVNNGLYDNRTPLFALPVYMHFPHWYQAERRGIVDFNFADFYSQMARYGTDAGPESPNHSVGIRQRLSGTRTGARLTTTLSSKRRSTSQTRSSKKSATLSNW